MDTSFLQNQDELADIGRRYGITFLAVFGSIARGEATAASDVDLAVRFGRPITLFDLTGAELEMEAALGRPVDLIPMDSVYSFVKETMIRDWVVVYDASEQDIHDDPEADADIQ